MSNQEQTILAKLRSLPPDKIAAVEDFIDFLRQQKTEPINEVELERKLQQRLLEKGLLSEIKPPITDFSPYHNRQPIEVKGKPISEIIIEERR